MSERINPAKVNGTVRVSVETPRLPNFLKVSDGTMHPVHAFDDKILRALAHNWTRLLLLKARNGRRAAKHPPHPATGERKR